MTCQDDSEACFKDDTLGAGETNGELANLLCGLGEVLQTVLLFNLGTGAIGTDATMAQVPTILGRLHKLW